MGNVSMGVWMYESIDVWGMGVWGNGSMWEWQYEFMGNGVLIKRNGDWVHGAWGIGMETSVWGQRMENGRMREWRNGSMTDSLHGDLNSFPALESAQLSAGMSLCLETISYKLTPQYKRIACVCIYIIPSVLVAKFFSSPSSVSSLSFTIHPALFTCTTLPITS